MPSLSKTTRYVPMLCVLNVIVGESLFSRSAHALATAGNPIVVASGNARCNTDPDVAWFAGEYVIVFGSRACPANANDATVMMTRYRPGVMPAVANPVVGVRLATDALGRVSVRGNILRTIVGHRLLGGWQLRTEDTDSLGVMREQSQFTFPPAQAFDRMGLDCTNNGCTVATRHGVNPGGVQVGMLSEDLSVFTPLRNTANYAEISALQVGGQSNVFFTVGDGDPRFFRFSPPNPLTPIAPMGPGPSGISIVSTRYQGGIATLYTMDEANPTVRLDRNGVPEDFPSIGRVRLTDADARGPNIYGVGVSAPRGAEGSFAFLGRNVFGFYVGSLARTSTIADSDVIRLALETGSGHSGTGVIVYDREVAGGTREVLLSLLTCNQDSDCFDGDDTTPDLCMGAGVNARCVRPQSDAGVNTDVPTIARGDVVEADDGRVENDTDALSDASTDGAEPPIDGIAMDVRSLLDTGPARDDAVAMDAAVQPPSVQVAYGGGACSCRAGAPTGERSAKMLAFVWIAAAVVLRNRRAHFGNQRRVRTC